MPTNSLNLRIDLDAKTAQRNLAAFTASVQDASGKTVSSLSQARGGVQSISQSLERLQGLAAVVRGVKGGVSEATSAVFSLQGALAGLGLGAIARQSIEAADSMSLMRSKLQLVNGDFGKLQQLAYQTRQGLQPTVEMYTRLARATQEYGTSQQDVLKVTGAINKAIIVSGASATEAEAAIIQLSQGMAAGALRGEELNSVMEQTPRVARMIADGLGVSIGKLRELGSQGKLTTDLLIKALLDQSRAVDSEFSKMSVTVGQAMTNLRSSVTVAVGEIDAATGASSRLATTINDVAGEVAVWVRENEALISQRVDDVIDATAAAFSGLSSAYSGLKNTWDGLPEWARDVGLVAALFGGRSGFAAVAAYSMVSEAVDLYVKQLQGLRDEVQKSQAQQEAISDGHWSDGFFSGEDIELSAGAMSRLNDQLDRMEGLVTGTETYDEDFGHISDGLEQATGGAAGLNDELAVTPKKIDAIDRALESAFRTLDEAADRIGDELIDAMDSFYAITDEQEMQRIDQLWEERLRRERDQAKSLADTHEDTSEEVSEFWKEAMGDMQSFTKDLFVDAFKGDLNDLGAAFEDFLVNMVANWAATQLQMALWGDSKDGMSLLSGGLSGGGMTSLGLLTTAAGMASGNSALSLVGIGASLVGDTLFSGSVSSSMGNLQANIADYIGNNISADAGNFLIDKVSTGAFSAALAGITRLISGIVSGEKTTETIAHAGVSAIGGYAMTLNPYMGAIMLAAEPLINMLWDRSPQYMGALAGYDFQYDPATGFTAQNVGSLSDSPWQESVGPYLSGIGTADDMGIPTALDEFAAQLASTMTDVAAVFGERLRDLGLAEDFADTMSGFTAQVTALGTDSRLATTMAELPGIINDSVELIRSMEGFTENADGTISFIYDRLANPLGIRQYYDPTVEGETSNFPATEEITGTWAGVLRDMGLLLNVVEGWRPGDAVVPDPQAAVSLLVGLVEDVSDDINGALDRMLNDATSGLVGNMVYQLSDLAASGFEAAFADLDTSMFFDGAAEVITNQFQEGIDLLRFPETITPAEGETFQDAFQREFGEIDEGFSAIESTIAYVTQITDALTLLDQVFDPSAASTYSQAIAEINTKYDAWAQELTGYGVDVDATRLEEARRLELTTLRDQHIEFFNGVIAEIDATPLTDLLDEFNERVEQGRLILAAYPDAMSAMTSGGANDMVLAAMSAMDAMRDQLTAEAVEYFSGLIEAAVGMEDFGAAIDALIGIMAEATGFVTDIDAIGGQRPLAESVQGGLADLWTGSNPAQQMMERILAPYQQASEADIFEDNLAAAISNYNALVGLFPEVALGADEIDALAISVDNMRRSLRGALTDDQLADLTNQIAIASGETTSIQLEREALLKTAVEASDYAAIELYRTLWNLEDAAAAAQNNLAALEVELGKAEGLLNRSFDAARDQLVANYEIAMDVLREQLDTVTTSVNDLTGAVDSLSSAKEAMLGSSGLDSMLYADAQRSLSAMLGQARGGDFSFVGDQLDNVLSTLSKDNSQYYGSYTDYQRDFWTQYLGVSELEQLTGDQLTAEEQMVEALQAQIDAAETQHQEDLDALDALLNATLGVDTSVTDLTAAIAAYNEINDAYLAQQAEIAAMTPDTPMVGTTVDEMISEATGISELVAGLAELIGGGETDDDLRLLMEETPKALVALAETIAADAAAAAAADDAQQVTLDAVLERLAPGGLDDVLTTSFADNLGNVITAIGTAAVTDEASTTALTDALLDFHGSVIAIWDELRRGLGQMYLTMALTEANTIRLVRDGWEVRADMTRNWAFELRNTTATAANTALTAAAVTTEGLRLDARLLEQTITLNDHFAGLILATVIQNSLIATTARTAGSVKTGITSLDARLLEQTITLDERFAELIRATYAQSNLIASISVLATGSEDKIFSSRTVNDATATIYDWARADVDIPRFAVGTNYVPRDMLAMVHEGETITPRPYVDSQAEERRELASAMRDVADEIRALRFEQAKNAYTSGVYAKRSADVLEKFDVIGMPDTRS